MITKIQITNIKGFGSANNILDVELQPSKVNIVVAPNGFGKTSLTTAFKCVMKNSRRLEVEKDLKYHKDESKTSVFRITEEGTTYVLVVHQGDSVVTLFFEDLKVETHLYRYGDLGHFWVKGYEYLRQLEYRIAILHTKCEYLGEDAASEEERKLAELVYFPPLNYACYPAVSQKYIVPMKDVWEPTERAISIMEELAAEANDHSLLRGLSFYRKHHGKGMSRLLAWMMHRIRHGAVIDLLIDKLMRTSEGYPVRIYHAEILMCAMQRKAELESLGKKVTLVREEPFTTAQDSVEYNVYLMIWKKKWGNRVVEIEHIS